MAMPEILTERLELRGVVREDAAGMFAYASNPEVLRYTTGRTPTRLEETQAFVEGLVDKPAGAYAWALRLKGTARVIGAVEYGVGDGKTGSLDYALARECWGKGLMTEACRAVLDWGFRAHPDLQRVRSSAVVVNWGSRRVMEKCGMEFQKTVREKWEKQEALVELAVYEIERTKWEKRRGPVPG
jgi:RimJ/RimL family protein N-acetyltransferase